MHILCTILFSQPLVLACAKLVIIEGPPEGWFDRAAEAIDAIDVELVKLLRDRADYIDRAVTLKQANGWPARIQSRVEEVIANACRVAEAEGLDPQLVERIWRDMVDWSISREAREIPET